MASVVRTLLRPASLLAPLNGSDRIAPAIGDFYIWASGGSVTLPAARYDYNSDWTPLLAGLSPAGIAARLAARSKCEELNVSKSSPLCPIEQTLIRRAATSPIGQSPTSSPLFPQAVTLALYLPVEEAVHSIRNGPRTINSVEQNTA